MWKLEGMKRTWPTMSPPDSLVLCQRQQRSSPGDIVLPFTVHVFYHRSIFPIKPPTADIQ